MKQMEDCVDPGTRKCCPYQIKMRGCVKRLFPEMAGVHETMELVDEALECHNSSVFREFY